MQIKEEKDYFKLITEWHKIIEKTYAQFSSENYKNIWLKKSYKNR